MGLDGIRVNHGALDQASADMYKTVQDIDERLNRLESELEPLRSQWGGDAQVAYAHAKRTWDDAILQMRNLLDDSQRTVFQSNQDYKDADKRGAAMFQ
ncbi:WXG100 family type VII secretion target [Nocardioides sp. 1609]|uniref:WXG100 family type VII secretion target n=1 Tax=Nocardioides sp. 1609 TaxID=2508327 RepID=UPI00107044BE|nr:WXG100 family type VII secretion target [Nocardioides sp. 1609]